MVECVLATNDPWAQNVMLCGYAEYISVPVSSFSLLPPPPPPPSFSLGGRTAVTVWDRGVGTCELCCVEC